jgi:hypothetical protein
MGFVVEYGAAPGAGKFEVLDGYHYGTEILGKKGEWCIYDL